MNLLSRYFFRPGDVVAVSFGFYRHVGLVSDSLHWPTAEPLVFSGTARLGIFAEEPLSAFAQNRVVTYDGYPGALPRREVIQRARSLLGQPWHLLFNNCEHLVREAHGLPR